MGWADELDSYVSGGNRYLREKDGNDTRKITVYIDSEMVEAMDVMIANLKGGASRSDFVRRAMSLYMSAINK